MRRDGMAWLMFVTLVGAALLPPLRAGALVPSIPAFGYPFSSRTADGGRFLGSFDFDQFVQDEAGNLVARGVVLSTPATVPGEPIAVPVRILVATCDLLHLELGPITQLGLLDPFHVVLQEKTDELDRGEHCAIATAAASGDPARLVSLLNQEARFGPGGTERHSCPWTQWEECSNAISSCSVQCNPIPFLDIAAVSVHQPSLTARDPGTPLTPEPTKKRTFVDCGGIIGRTGYLLRRHAATTERRARRGPTWLLIIHGPHSATPRKVGVFRGVWCGPDPGSRPEKGSP